MDVLVLGPVEGLKEGARVPIGGPKQRSILALLAVAGQDAWALGDPETSASLQSGAETLRAEIGFIRPASSAQELQDEYADLRRTLGSESFESTWNRGTSLDRDDMDSRASVLLGASGPTD